MAEMFAQDVSEIIGCGEGHQLSFYCQECNRLYCGNCITKTHRGALKGHDVEDFEKRVELEGAEVNHLIEGLQQLSDSAETAALAKDANAEASLNVLTEFFSNVERSLMTAQMARDAQVLHRLRRECIQILQWSSFTQSGIDSETDPVGVLNIRRTIGSRLKKQVEETKKSLANAATRKFDVVDVIYKAAVALRGRANLEGVYYKYDVFNKAFIFLFFSIVVKWFIFFTDLQKGGQGDAESACTSSPPKIAKRFARLFFMFSRSLLNVARTNISGYALLCSCYSYNSYNIYSVNIILTIYTTQVFIIINIIHYLKSPFLSYSN